MIVYSRWDRSPDIIEDQVTYPIVTALLGAPQREGDPRLLRLRLLLRLRHLRGRHRPLLGAQPRPRVPEQDPAAPARGRAAPSSGPDATGVGWVFQYALVDDSGTHDLAELRTLPGLVPALPAAGVPGVAEVASVGGFVKQYQVTVDPNRLRAYEPRRSRTSSTAIRAGQRRGRRAAARVRGHASTWCAAAATCGSREDLERSSLKTDERGHAGPACATWARWRSGPRSGAASRDLDGQGDTVGGIVVMRHGENALRR